MSKPLMFADDTNLTCVGQSSSEIETKLIMKSLGMSTDGQQQINLITLNDEKTEFMLIGSRSRLASVNNSPNLKLGHRHIKRVYYKKSLGMVLDEQLKWNKHNEVQSFSRSIDLSFLDTH